LGFMVQRRKRPRPFSRRKTKGKRKLTIFEGASFRLSVGGEQPERSGKRSVIRPTTPIEREKKKKGGMGFGEWELRLPIEEHREKKEGSDVALLQA